MKPEIGVHILSYNREAYVAEAIRSVQRQTYGNFRLVVWDDGSTDNSANIAERLAREDDRVEVVRADHRGLIPSRQAASIYHDTPYLCWVDSDDILEPTAFEETWRVLKDNPDVGMVYTNRVNIDGEGRELGPDRRNNIPYSPFRLLTDFMTFHFRLIRRTAFSAAGGVNAGVTYAEDYDMCLRLSEVTRIVHLKRNLYRYRRHADTISTARRYDQIVSSIAAVDRAIKRRGLEKEIIFSPEIRAVFSLVPRTQNGARILESELGPPRGPATHS